MPHTSITADVVKGRGDVVVSAFAHTAGTVRVEVRARAAWCTRATHTLTVTCQTVFTIIINYYTSFKECMSDSVTNYNYVGDTTISVSIKKLMPTNAY